MPNAGATHKTVLIADGTPFVRERFRSALERAGHRACTVQNAAELLARVGAGLSDIDLVVVDLRLPQAGGVDLVRSIRELDGGTLPILVFSGTITAASEVRELTELGVAGYVNEHSAAPHILPSLAPHLFPDNFNRRNSSRVVLGIPVAYRVANTIATAVTLNLGKNGVAVRTMSPLDSSVRARIRFRLPRASQDVDADARVTWSDHRLGMGLEFERIDSADQSAVDEFVNGRGRDELSTGSHSDDRIVVGPGG
jgi:CheY-like chemotaxis protein